MTIPPRSTYSIRLELTCTKERAAHIGGTTPPAASASGRAAGESPPLHFVGFGVGLRTNVYIDGFNLYYGRLRGTSYKWLDLERFCDELLPKNDIRRILYFTAKVDARPHDPDQPTRQLAYLRALATLPRVEVHFGTFMTSVIRQPLVETDPLNPRRWRMASNVPVLKTTAAGDVETDWVLKTEEKGSDVNLASHLLRDTYRGDCECAVVVSNDSDLLTPIRMAKAHRQLTIGLIPPRAKGSVELKSLADFKVDPRVSFLSGSQFPANMTDANGVIQKPPAW